MVVAMVATGLLLEIAAKTNSRGAVAVPEVDDADGRPALAQAPPRPPGSLVAAAFASVGGLAAAVESNESVGLAIEIQQTPAPTFAEQERARLRAILDTMPDGIYIVNSTFEMEYANPVIERQFGIAKGRNALLGLRGATPIEGGIPIMVGGKVIGAIGVSGANADQDAAAATAGLKALQP